MMPSASTKGQPTTQMKTVPPPVTPAPPAVVSESGDGLKTAIITLEKKLRNLEKRKTKLDSYRTKFKEGKTLDKDQKDAMLKYDEVSSSIDFAKEFLKQLTLMNQETDRILKKQQKKERQDRMSEDKVKIKEVLEIQEMLNALGNEETRTDFQSGNRGAVVLTTENLDHLDQLYKLISPTRDDPDYTVNLLKAAEHINNLIDERPWPIFNTTYKDLRDLSKLIMNCGYLEKMSERVTTAEETTDTPEPTGGDEVASPDTVTDDVQTEENVPSETTEEVSPELPPTSDQPISDATADAMFSDPSFQPSAWQGGYSSTPTYTEPKRQFQDIMSSVKGSFDFLQESTIEESDATHIDPAIVAVHSRPTLPQAIVTGPTTTGPTTTTQFPPSDTSSYTPQNIDTRRKISGQNIDYSSAASYGQNYAPTTQSYSAKGSNVAYRGDDGASSHAISHDLSDLSGPPPIPLPNQSNETSPSAADKKFTMNANAAVFTSMYEGGSASDEDIAASSQDDSRLDSTTTSQSPSDSAYDGDSSNQRPQRGGGNQGYRGNRGGRGGSGGGYNRGGAASVPPKVAYKGYPPRDDYKPAGYQGYNNNGFNQGYTKPQGAPLKGLANALRGGGGGGGQRGASRGGTSRPTGAQ